MRTPTLARPLESPARLGTAAGVVAAAALLCASAAGARPAASYQSKADALCTAGLKQMKSKRVPTSMKDFILYLETEARLGDALLERLSALRPPRTRRTVVGAAIRAQRRFQERVHLLIGQLKRSPKPKLTLQTAEPELTALAEAARTAWRKAGLPKCAA